MNQIETIGLRRRGLLTGAVALGALGFGGLVQAKAPLLGTQAPYWYRFRIGAFEATIVSDGQLPLGSPTAAFLGVTKAEIDTMLSANFLPSDNAVLEQNVLVVNTGERVIVFDTGMGKSEMFGKKTGRLMANLRAAGIDPASVDAVVATHAHVDHIGGIAEDGKALFPNAQVYIAQADLEFWTDEGKLGGPMKAFVEMARSNLLPVRDRIVFYKDGQEFLPGIVAMAAHGHTVGHTMFVITSGGQSLTYVGDLTHHQVLLLEKPLTEFAYDTDPKAAAQTRVRYLNSFAANRTTVLAYHFPFPGIGNIAKAGDGFRYFPRPMDMQPG